MKASELRGLAVEELTQKSRELRDEYFNVKVKHTTGQLENTAKLNVLRRDVARVATVLQQKREAMDE
jgi:large subunit ribosomal protein L29